jgi:hypothetical protein
VGVHADSVQFLAAREHADSGEDAAELAEPEAAIAF